MGLFKPLLALTLGACLLASTWAEPRRARKLIDDEHQVNKTRTGKVFSLFNVIEFKNDPCSSTSTISSGGSGSNRRNGTCLTASECRDKSGTSSGNCAAGFGVCCVFLVSESGSTIDQNCTYVRNPNFPSAYTSTSNVMYTVDKCDDNVCSLRLDFESFTILGTGSTEETTGGVCLDTFAVGVNTNQNVPTICGQNTGQHMYVDIGRGSSDSATMSFTFSSTTTSNTRQWEIKVTQVPCADYNAPSGCLQYHNGNTGRLTTFNFLPSNDNHLQNQDYSICIRQEAGMCCVEYTVCADTNSMTLALKANGIDAMSGTDTACSFDYFAIGASGHTCQMNPGNDFLVNKFCGTFFSASLAMEDKAHDAVCDCTAPFRVDIFTDALNDEGAATANAAHSRGLCLQYRQLPC